MEFTFLAGTRSCKMNTMYSRKRVVEGKPGSWLGNRGAKSFRIFCNFYYFLNSVTLKVPGYENSSLETFREFPLLRPRHSALVCMFCEYFLINISRLQIVKLLLDQFAGKSALSRSKTFPAPTASPLGSASPPKIAAIPPEQLSGL